MPALLERPKMTQAMAAALKHHILKERERKRQEEEEADKAIERKKEERERERKKAEAESLNLEETREEIQKLEDKLKELQHQKHELFLQLKKVLNEDENRRRQKIKEQSEREFIHPSMSHPQYHQNLTMAGPPMMVHGHITAGRPALLGDSPKGHIYRPQTPPSQAVHPGVKRPRSPSPPVVQLYPQRPSTQGAYAQNQHHSSYAAHQTAHTSYHGGQHHSQAAAAAPYQQGHSSYSGNKSSSNYPNQSHVSYPGAQQQATHSNYPATQSGNSKYTSNQSAFSSYPAHYVPQQPQMNAQNYQLQQQQRYMQPGGQHGQHSSNMSMQQQLEHANQQSGFSEEQGHYKLPQQQQQQAAQQPQGQAQAQQQHIRPLAQAHHAAIHPQQSHQPMLSQPLQPQMHLQPGNKPSIVTGYAARQTRPSSPMYHPKQQAQPQHQQPQPPQPQQHGASYQSQSPRHGHPSTYLNQQPSGSRW